MTGMEDVLAAIEDIVHAETGQHVFRSGWDGSFTPAAGSLVEKLTAAGFGNLHDAWADGVEAGFDYAANDHTPSGHSIDPPANPHPKVSES